MHDPASDTEPPELPSYADLEARTDGRPPGTSWGVFGDDDELGTISLLGRAQVLAGLGAAITGEVVSLNWQFDLPAPNPYRSTPERVQLGKGRQLARDDYVAPFHLQYSSQWDGLRHVQSKGAFYNGVSPDTVDDPASTTLGIHRWADHGIVGRGVLLDVAAWATEHDPTFHPSSSYEITPDILDATAAEQSVTVEHGDILLVRTGWCGWYAAQDQTGREDAVRSGPKAPQPGLSPDKATAAWLWDHHVAAVACDNTSVELGPIDMTNFLHERLIAQLGLAIGEHFWLDGLALRCRQESRWTFLFTSAPLNVPGGVGSPPNALAIL